MIKILIVDDCPIKTKRVKDVITTFYDGVNFLQAENNAEAINSIRNNTDIDLMILDLNLPIRKGESAKGKSGLVLLREIIKRHTLIKPKYIVGLTAFKEILNESVTEFNREGWIIVPFDIKNTDWEEVLKNKIDHILNTKNSKLSEKRDKCSRALIMKGGGIKGIAYMGALEVLSDYYEFDWYAGTSAGAISAILLAAGYNHQELKDILKNKNFNDFKDANYFGRIYNLISKKGLYEAHEFTNWMNKLLSVKLDSPTEVKLKDLPYRASVYSSTIGKNALVYDSYNKDAENIPAAFAARCSMSIPYIFVPQKINGHDVFDGGLQNNYPIELIMQNDSNIDFIGLYLGNEHYSGKNRKSTINKLLSIWSESNDIVALEKHKDSTIIINPHPISTLKFNLNDKEKNFLLESGRLSAIKFLIKKGVYEGKNENYDERKNELENLRQYLINKKIRKKRIIVLLILVSILITLLFYFFH